MTYTRQADFGTPESKSTQSVTLSIDGRAVTVPAGSTVMRAASEIGTNIPKLCATDSLKQFGSCRLCLVEIDGARGTPASCTTPVSEGMVVHTQTPKLQKLRKGVMELYISDHPLDCLTCAANGDCELQDQAGAVGLRDVRYGYEGANHLGQAKDHSNPYFDFDSSKCIVCSRCVRACEEVQGTFALTIEGRGFGSRVSPGMHQMFIDSECVSCGACVQACPTATLTEKSVIQIGQPEHSVVTTERSGVPISTSAFSVSVAVGQAWTQAPQETHSEERKSSTGVPAETFEPKPRLSIVSANVPCTSSQARTQREQTMHLDESKSK